MRVPPGGLMHREIGKARTAVGVFFVGVRYASDFLFQVCDQSQEFLFLLRVELMRRLESRFQLYSAVDWHLATPHSSLRWPFRSWSIPSASSFLNILIVVLTS